MLKFTYVLNPHLKHQHMKERTMKLGDSSLSSDSESGYVQDPLMVEALSLQKLM